MPGVFSPFRRKVEKNLTIRPELPKPLNIKCSWNPKKNFPTCPILMGAFETGFAGGSGLPGRGNRGRELDEGMDLERTAYDLQGDAQWFAGSGLLFEIRLAGQRMPLAVKTHWEIKRFEEEREPTKAPTGRFELLKEFFRFARSHGSKIFRSGGIRPGESTGRRGDPRTLEKWKLGRTADDFVNANMIELARTGWMSNRE